MWLTIRFPAERGGETRLRGVFQRDPPAGIPPLADAAGYVRLEEPFRLGGQLYQPGSWIGVACDAAVTTEDGTLLHRPRRPLLPGLWVLLARGSCQEERGE